MRQKHNRIPRQLVLYSAANDFGVSKFSGNAAFTGYTCSKGTIDTNQIKCSVYAANHEYEDTSYANYIMLSEELDCAALRGRGLTKLSFSGTYSVKTTVSGVDIAAYTNNNVYSAFVALVPKSAAITIGNTGITNAERLYQITGHVDGTTKYHYFDFQNKSGGFNGSIILPDSGTVVLVVGVLQRNIRAETTLTVTNLLVT